MKIDLKISKEPPKPINDDRYTIDIPKSAKREFMKIPAKARNNKMREIIFAMIKENAS